MMTTLPAGTDQLIDAAMARALHADACRDHALVAWVVLWDLPAYPERYAARLATSGQAPSPYLLLTDTLAGIRAMLPPSTTAGLARHVRREATRSDVQVWIEGLKGLFARIALRVRRAEL